MALGMENKTEAVLQFLSFLQSTLNLGAQSLNVPDLWQELCAIVTNGPGMCQSS